MSTTTVTLMSLLAMTCLVQVESKVVVTIPFPYTSHTKYHTNVARLLAGKGHEVWVAMASYVLEKGYIDTSGFNVIPFDTIPNVDELVQDALSRSYFEQNQDKFFEFLDICGDIFKSMLSNETFITTIKQKQPDLIVIDNLPMFYPISIIPYRLGVPFAFMGSVYFAPMLRVPFSAAETPISIFQYSNKMTFSQRLYNTLFYVILIAQAYKADGVVAEYAPEMEYVPFSDLVNKADIFLVEHDHILDYPKPTLPNVKLIGGTATGPAKPLPPEFQSFMDSAKEGVVIVTFGSYVLHLPKHISDKILQVLLQLPMKSIFRSNLTSPDPKKIMMSTWIPQNDLLGHPNTKVFVSHCGKNGQYEALYHAVPIVATPLFADQPYNAERVRVKGFAEVLDINTCTAEQMKSTILAVANEPKYKEAVVKRSLLFKELYGVPMDTAAFWLEHVMEHGGEYMRSAGQQMPFYQFLMLDVLLFIVCVLALAVVLLCVFIKAICGCLQGKKTKRD